ncbi:hypothetical protein SAMN02927923_03436 [Microvirga guangxiensis]|uniref:Transposase n=1 Tax=Microvirga guangxiensis TaxID=549386 RepID=A0A1G5KLD5_9HYPH|nr:hypothetical protein SAMN02927923_03436 [Microvirga guangxiensis]
MLVAYKSRRGIVRLTRQRLDLSISQGMEPTRPRRYARHRYPAEVISHAVWLYFRFPLSLRLVEGMLAARSIEVSHETIWQRALKFGHSFANQIRRRLPPSR